MSRTVDLVVDGECRTAVTAAFHALSRNRRVLIVLRSGRTGALQCIRKRLCQALNGSSGQLTIMKHAEVVCVDGIYGVEAVVIRDLNTGHLYGVNSSGFLSCEDSPWTTGHIVDRKIETNAMVGDLMHNKSESSANVSDA